MVLSLDISILGAAEQEGAAEFYQTVFAPETEDYGGFARLDLHGTGDFGVAAAADLIPESASAGSGFGGFIVSCVLRQPQDVIAVLRAAEAAGARVLKPAKKAIFGSFSGVFEAPGGAVWKVSAETKKDKGEHQHPPQPVETGIILGVADPKASKAFYAALGMRVDRDYGSKYIDFSPAQKGAGQTSRLCLMQRKDLAADVGMSPEGEGFPGLVLSQDVSSREGVETTLGQAASAGGTVTQPASDTEWGGCTGHFTDPDGYLWKIACS